MNRHRALLGVGLMLLAAVGAPAAALSPGPVAPAQQAGNDTASAGNSSTGPLPPGAQLSAAVEVHQAEVDGEIEERSFGIAVAEAATNDSKAAVVGDRVQNLEDRLATLREREARLTEAHESGNMSEARYRAEVAGLTARIQVLARQANRTAEVSARLPRAALEARGVDASAIQSLRQNASGMAGREVAAIARSIGGPPVGQGLGVASRGPPADRPEPPGQNRSGRPTADRPDPGTATVDDVGGNVTVPGPPRNGTDRGPPSTTERTPVDTPDRPDGGPPENPGGGPGDGGAGGDGDPGDGGGGPGGRGP